MIATGTKHLSSRRWRLGACMVGVLTAGTVSAVSPAASADSPVSAGSAGLPAGVRTWSELFSRQEALDAVASRVQAASPAGSGFTDLRVDPAGNAVTVYWKGPVSTGINRVIADARARGIRVSVVRAAYSATELDAQVDLILRDARSASGGRVVSVTKYVDGRGVEVGVSGIPGHQALGSGLPHLQQARRAGNVTVVKGEPFIEFTREADTPPYWGGALMFRDNYSAGCSTGFATYWPAGNEKFLSTAGHCGTLGSIWTSGAGSVIGRVQHKNTAHDAMFIRTAPAARIYWGPAVFFGRQSSKPVKGQSQNNNGDFVCLSGALTGAVCSAEIDNRNIVRCLPVGGCVNLIGAIPRDPTLFVSGQGDSGGPVVTLTDNNAGVIARGTISGSYGTVRRDCPNPLHGRYPDRSPTRVCSNGVAFADVTRGMEILPGMHVLTE
jgi:hypothetical protein